ncbi:Uncharacterised protein [uncultured archaeon]|nr:Uncharacterised protein [uncultured archaeon]
MGMAIFLNKSEYRAGDEVEATIRLDLGKPTKARGLFATLIGTEQKKTTRTRHIPQAEIEEKRRLGLYTEVPFTQETQIEDRVIFQEEKKVAGEGAFEKGEYNISIRLPPGAPPTSREFGHDNKINVWKLNVKLDIPFAIDVNASHEVFVGGL